MKHTEHHAIDQRRRALLKGASAAALAAGAPAMAAENAAVNPWTRAERIAAKFAKPLSFPARDFVITAHGARPCPMAEAKPLAGAHGTPAATQLVPAPGSPDSHPAIRAAIAAASQAGGGRVLIPAGDWYCKGPIVLRSNVNVHLAAGARVHFSANPADYARHGEFDCGPNGKLVLSRWQGNDCLNYSPMVYARNQNNIAITGEDWTSILNGQGNVPFEDGGADGWWNWAWRNKPAGATARQGVVNEANPASLSALAPQLTPAELALIKGSHADWRSDEKYLPALSEARVPAEQRVFGAGHYLRPCMIEFVGCTDVLMQGYQVVNTPFWQHHPVNCRNVHIKKVRMESMGPNSDGFDPESCDTILVDGCLFNTGDDCIAIKAGKNTDVQYGPTRDMVIQNSIMNTGHGAITLGSEMAAGIEHVYAQNLDVRNMHWATDPLGTAIRMKTNMNRGGFLRHFYVRQVTLANGVRTKPGFYTPIPGGVIAPKTVATSGGAIITIDCDYTPAFDSVRTRPPEVSDIHISDVRVANVQTEDGAYSCYQAFVLLGPVAHSYNGPAGVPLLPLANVTITRCDFGTPRAAEPWFVHNARNVTLSGVTIAGKRYDTRL
ncbi:glycoside hydrolase family 28 protein [Pseudoduganella aquatica]|uniref:Endopolygalacturonase n=1 Tax=Pseudoduganella aquatica TaxID=2660641 RepID=A0A7X4HF69_9BURK|nr:glycoside hydrolase family 28 protein [Pseudoduganella aquatica]MYN09859.1 endopolygalacturonase [Pseudoduganella aquatica]